MMSIEQHAKECKTPDWLFNAVKVHMGWAKGYECSREEYEAACEAVKALPIS